VDPRKYNKDSPGWQECNTQDCKPDHVACHWIYKGSGENSGDATCVPDTERHHASCCSSSPIAGFRNGTAACIGTAASRDSWDTSDFSGCQPALTYAENMDLCWSIGARLCTEAEMQDGCTVGTGCGYDENLLWTDRSGEAPTPVDCGGGWSDWGICSVECGGGSQSRVYDVVTEMANRGAPCPTDSPQTRECNLSAPSWGG